jgi:hypothetical protein
MLQYKLRISLLASQEILSSEIKEVPFKPVSNFGRDIIISSVYILLSIILFFWGQQFLYIGDLLLLLLGFVFIVFGVRFFLNNSKDAISAIQYKKAESVLGDRKYLRGIKPVCPYLNVTIGGFKCLLEFSKPFDIKDDLPRCHNEELSKLHWIEKAPQVFEALKKETGKQILNYLPALANAKYTPAIPYLENMLKYPKPTKELIFLIKTIPQAKSSDELEQLYIDFIMNQDPRSSRHAINSQYSDSDSDHEEENEFVETIKSEFRTYISLFKEIGFVKVTEEAGTIELTEHSQRPQFFKQWKLYSSNLVKQFTLASLGLFEDETLIPIFVDYILKSDDKKMNFYARNALKRQKDRSVHQIIKMIKDPSVGEEEKTILFETCSVLKNDEMFEFLKEFIEESDNDLLTAYAVSAIGKFGEKGNSVIMQVLEKDPDDLILETGRASLIKTPEHTFDLILEKLRKDNLPDDLLQILISIIEELDHKVITAKVLKMSAEEQDEVIDLFEKYDLDDYLDLFLPENF